MKIRAIAQLKSSIHSAIISKTLFTSYGGVFGFEFSMSLISKSRQVVRKTSRVPNTKSKKKK